MISERRLIRTVASPILDVIDTKDRKRVGCNSVIEVSNTGFMLGNHTVTSITDQSFAIRHHFIRGLERYTWTLLLVMRMNILLEFDESFGFVSGKVVEE